MIFISYLSKCSNGLISQVKCISSINRFKNTLLLKKKSDIESVSEVSPPVAGTYGYFDSLGLVPELVAGLTSQGRSFQIQLKVNKKLYYSCNMIEITIPTPVQKAVIPRLLNGENLVMAASTGSGKTLAYLLPIVQLLQTQESEGYNRQIKRPRCLILVPTRELARQVLVSVKSLSHYCRMSSCAVMGGEEFSGQKKSVSRCNRKCSMFMLVHFV